MIDTAARSSRRITSMGSVYASLIPASAAAFRALSRERLQMAATSQPSERKPGTWTCAPKPTPMIPILRADEDTNCSISWRRPKYRNNERALVRSAQDRRQARSQAQQAGHPPRGSEHPLLSQRDDLPWKPELADPPETWVLHRMTGGTQQQRR